ncbi:MAG: PqqD family protein [Longimicrobiales bacterium]
MSFVRPRPDVLVSQVGDESVLLDLASEQYFGLDAVGRAMWEQLAGASSVEAAIVALLAEFDVDRETLERDAATLVHELAARGLVDVCDDPVG